MEEIRKKRYVTVMVARIVVIYLVTFGILVLAAYYVLSQNFEKLLTDYSIQLVQSMMNLGMDAVERELQIDREEAEWLADIYDGSREEGLHTLASEAAQEDLRRIVYVSGNETITTDHRSRDISGRPDIVNAFDGETSMYGPYFNEEGEYVVCYSAPVMEDGRVTGVISVEQDGYQFCRLIKNIKFVNTGESYIINADGTDIAVSDHAHIDWVDSQYNARKILEQGEDPTTRSILELEQKGLDGETGVGTYYWNDGLVYVAYMPFSSTDWVLLGGLREEEIAAMTRTTLYASIAKGPVMGFCIAVFVVLTGIVLFWFISSMKKFSEINSRLNRIASYDALTGIRNRNSFHEACDTFSQDSCKSLACVYADANGLHELNNSLGHQAGDKMLIAVAHALENVFSGSDTYRIGGDEFLVLIKDQEKKDIAQKALTARKKLEEQGYDISVGIAWRDREIHINEIVNAAEESMLEDKRLYYKSNRTARQTRIIET